MRRHLIWVSSARNQREVDPLHQPFRNILGLVIRSSKHHKRARLEHRSANYRDLAGRGRPAGLFCHL